MSLEVKQLTKLYNSQRALNSISFEAKSGQVLGFLGPNGAGKSTTMKIASGYLLPDEGDVWVNGLSVSEHPKQVSKMIGYLPEHNPLYLDMYVKEFLLFMASLYRFKGLSAKSKIATIIEKCGLGAEQHKKIGQLSKGYRQRVGLAKALVHDPEVIILDEPTTGLDPNQLLEIRKLIREIGKDKTLILSTHIMQEVEAICEKVVIIHQGEIVAQDLLQNLKAGEGLTSVFLETEEQLYMEWFESLNGIQEIRPINDRQFEFLANSATDLRKELLTVVQERNLSLLSVRLQERNLESIFHQLTQS
ncbi:MAG TPA: gliding motility-associated ABC transporter ATP-binding subunit GldA [Cyclobacteriaceae bacterium]|nr:gliding motility-associated ABC transporter ATP-binding subunit GldA [Cyclobacteriaceae bacterium]